MSINKIVLEKDGLVVGTNQLVASGGGITVGQNLVVQGNLHPTALSANGSIGTSGQVLTSNGAGLYWSAGGTGSGNFTVSLSATAPTNPSFGSLWWNTENGLLYIYFNDGDSSQWVSISGPFTQSGVTTGKSIAMSIVFGG